MINKTIKYLIDKLEPFVRDKAQAQFEAWLLLEKATGFSRVQLLIRDKELSLGQQEALETLINQRVQGKPLAYILGSIPFAGINIQVRPPILIPRPETEEMVLWTIEKFASEKESPLRVLDMCTGSGCIALALASAFPAWQVFGIDNNEEAINLAQENKKLLKLENVFFEQGSLFNVTDWDGPYDLIISNPPYISESSRHLVGLDVLIWEDKNALFAQNEGNAFYCKLIELAKKEIQQVSGNFPQLIVEFGVDQDQMDKYLVKYACTSIEIYRDRAGIKRWAACQV
ncbi:peptide chain release factor N(5)-glutamine methyltransferase [Candidatus Dependentiae bacterium]|nr:peptide chain release factor N(5)-glutamine methyltransferase [Candidatus Dependentiae bacterium]